MLLIINICKAISQSFTYSLKNISIVLDSFKSINIVGYRSPQAELYVRLSCFYVLSTIVGYLMPNPFLYI